MDPRQQASLHIQAVEKAMSEARAKWSGWSVSVGSYFGTPQDQVLGALRSIETLGVKPWKARADKLTRTDQVGWDRWTKDGNDLLHNLATTAQDAETGTLGAIIAEPIRATAAQVSRGAARVATGTVQAAQSVWGARKLIVAGLGAVAVAALAFVYLRARR